MGNICLLIPTVLLLFYCSYGIRGSKTMNKKIRLLLTYTLIICSMLAACNQMEAEEKHEVETDSVLQMRYHVASIISKMCVVGDSLSVGWGLNGGGDNPTDNNISRTNLNISWPQQYARLTGTEVLNIGGSGLRAEQFWEKQFSSPNHSDMDFKEYLNYLDNECELYLIGLGLNFEAETAGTTADIGQTADACNEKTFYGAYTKIIMTIAEKYPNATILCLTIPEKNSDTQNSIIRDIIANISNAKLLDLKKDYMDLIARDDILSQRTVLRNIHYYPVGYSLLAQTMEYILSDYIWQNASDFKSFGIM